MTTITTEERLGRLEAGQAGIYERLGRLEAGQAAINQRLDDSSTRQMETNSRLDKVIFTLFGIGAGVIATLVTAIFAVITSG